MPEITVKAEPADANGKYRVITQYGTRQHVDKVDPDSSFVRQKWREAACKECRIRGEWTPEGGDNDAAIHAELENKLMAAVIEADMGPAVGVWQPTVSTMATIAPQTTAWLWEQHFPAGAISVIDGDPGLGKSQLTTDIGARVTRGHCMPPHLPLKVGEPRGVLMMNAEDDPARTLRPRLEAAGADLNRVHCLRTMQCAVHTEDERPVSLPMDLPAVEAVIREHDVALAVLDPFVAYLDGKLSMNNDADVRRCLGQVAAVAEATGCAFVLVRHLNKKSGLNAVYRGGGSIGITGAARAVFMVGVDPADESGRIFACVKSNLAPEPASLRFSIEAHGTTSRVRWGDACDTTAHDLCQNGKSERGGGKLDTAKGIIEDILGDGSRGSNEIEVAMDQAGISKSTYWRARRELGVTAEKTEYQGQWLLSLPSTNGFHDPEF